MSELFITDSGRVNWNIWVFLGPFSVFVSHFRWALKEIYGNSLLVYSTDLQNRKRIESANKEQVEITDYLSRVFFFFFLQALKGDWRSSFR